MRAISAAICCCTHGRRRAALRDSIKPARLNASRQTVNEKEKSTKQRNSTQCRRYRWLYFYVPHFLYTVERSPDTTSVSTEKSSETHDSSITTSLDVGASCETISVRACISPNRYWKFATTTVCMCTSCRDYTKTRALRDKGVYLICMRLTSRPQARDSPTDLVLSRLNPLCNDFSSALEIRGIVRTSGAANLLYIQ